MTECQRIIEQGFINREYLNQETRDDYLITTEKKKVWVIELDLLRTFIDICKKYSFRYWVGFGTLLGAVRHQGFIPWDDDVDVWMPRADYDRLLEISKDDIPFPYFLQTTLNDDDYYSAFARLRNSMTTGILVSGSNKCNNGIYIDIYPIDGQFNNKTKQKRISRYIYGLNVAAHAYMYNVNPNPVTKALHKFLRFPFIPYDYRRTYKYVNTLARKVAWNSTDTVGIVVFWPYPFEKTTFRKEDFEKSISAKFENLDVQIPAGYDRILTTLYGDYMKFPPLEKRGAWHNFTFDPDRPYNNLERE